MTLYRKFGIINLLREVVGGRPLPLGCGGPRARPRFRQVSSIVRRELTRPRAGGRPTTRDPGQDLQSLPLPICHAYGPTYTWCMVCMICVSCYARLLRVLCAVAAEGEASRRERRDGWTLTVRSVCFCFLPAFQVGSQNGPPR